MFRKNGEHTLKVNGYAPEKRCCNVQFSKVNGYAPEKLRF